MCPPAHGVTGTDGGKGKSGKCTDATGVRPGIIICGVN